MTEEQLVKQLLQQGQIEQAQEQIRAQQRLVPQQYGNAINIEALGRILLYNHQMNAAIQQAAPPEPQLNAEPPRVTVQDIFNYHLLKDNCTYCQRPYRQCPVHNVSQ